MDFCELNIISSKQFHSREDLGKVFTLAKRLEPIAHAKEYCGILKDKMIATLFYEPSTRTKLSFQAAAQRLGAKIISESGIHGSSLEKGESLEDTLRMLENYADLIIMRHPEPGIAEKVSKVVSKPFINAGDGSGEHPTQALLDMYTILKEQGKVDNLHITLVGDLKNGRTVHSLIYLLKHYKVDLNLISPSELSMPENIIQDLKESGCNIQVGHSLKEAIADTDVLYMTRIQKERFKNIDDYERLKNSFILNSELLKEAKESITILHPLPRITEIDESVDSHKGAAYFRQAGNGVPVRMALILLLLG
ncbi:aspartate carbamoyltransferase, partial [Candidatus Peregrinibacteria bacterium]|nr:aspartate carbamoyltransferase [Candidatus Peregrinibacteria bacterium]